VTAGRLPVARGARVGHDRGVRAPSRVRTRDGKLVPFDRRRIEAAVAAAGREVGRTGPDVAPRAAAAVVDDLAARFARGTPTVEDVQDAVERALMAAALDDVARAYVVFRARKAELRRAKAMLGVRDELKLSLAACTVLGERYLRRDASGAITESTAGMLERVAAHVASAEDRYEPGRAEHWAPAFRDALMRLDFLPNSPTLMNAGTPLGLLSACFVLPLEDSLDSIFTTLALTARIHQAGGGTGFAFSRLRPEGARVTSTGGTASGPLSFLELFDLATEIVGRGGRRRGANMAVLDVSHPDIRAFVTAKHRPGRFEHCNLSVGVNDRFMRAALDGDGYPLRDPRTGKAAGKVDAAALLRLVAEEAWTAGDPGLLFLDRINRANPVPSMGRILATNPCGEVPLLANESCTLASVNLARHVRAGRVDWAHLDATVRLAVRFLDDVLDVNRYPSDALTEAALATRKIGVGMMGLAELLAALGLPYGSDEAARLAARIAARIQGAAVDASVELAAERGPFPAFDRSTFARRGRPPRRHAQLTSVAPTGTISLVAGTTSGIEPMFAVAYARRTLGRELLEVNALFERIARDQGFWSDALVSEIARTGTVTGNPAVPAGIAQAFVTALELEPAAHLRMQAAIQRHVDAAVAKTINLPAHATVDDVHDVFVEAWRAAVKGITIYRDRSRPGQVLSLPAEADGPIVVDAGYAGGCTSGDCTF
jgi:ribonucleoside-diphosphate reductase alpha chain